jgi:hypothetical protein
MSRRFCGATASSEVRCTGISMILRAHRSRLPSARNGQLRRQHELPFTLLPGAFAAKPPVITQYAEDPEVVAGPMELTERTAIGNRIMAGASVGGTMRMQALSVAAGGPLAIERGVYTMTVTPPGAPQGTFRGRQLLGPMTSGRLSLAARRKFAASPLPLQPHPEDAGAGGQWSRPGRHRDGDDHGRVRAARLDAGDTREVIHHRPSPATRSGGETGWHLGVASV